MQRHAKSVLAVDLGGTKIRAGLVSADFRVHDVRSAATPKRGADRLLNALVGLLASYPRRSYACVCVGFAGLVTWPGGVVLAAPSIPDADGLRVKRLLALALRVPVIIDNDATLWTLGEARRGAGRGSRIVAGLILGTGVGGGLVIDGKVYRGKHNAIEFGHMTIAAGGDADRHGGRGHLEAYAGGWGMERAYRVRSQRRLTGQQIASAARRGERHALSMVNRAADALALGIVNLHRIIDPDIIVVGGSIAQMPRLLSTARTRVRHYIINTAYLDAPVVRARLGDNAPLIGAALLARDTLP